MSQDPEKVPFRRSIFLIDPPFQFRFSFYVCSWVLATGFLFPVLIYNLFSLFERIVPKTPAAVATVNGMRGDLLWMLVLLLAIYTTLTFLVSLFISHRLAGPVYKIRKVLAEFKEGQLSSRVFLRSKDHFRTLATDINHLLDLLEKQSNQNASSLSKIIEDLETDSSGKGPENLSKTIGQLSEVRERCLHLHFKD